MANVWVVEDDASIRNGLLRALSADGYDVEVSAIVVGVDETAHNPRSRRLECQPPGW